ncbi:hypothetical protein AN964_09440 [Heyndrickxia shackletonii]|uniref:Heptaprenyl diphosphate synthase n=1 Tax=Heyndrickxia shackletonii TaxID=157838 RepID=A0A0Q3WXU8_9BACI|nr:heptaprenyl diphosphate synthase component 1 [Heyndrickxia shackletonii]KQL53701.1 hypothetical protein AN964_09440 [Heyndrickxia shackletonii]NEY99840.1 heptaprenyl diphosphate synthase component 1 [Heyndrickxia shackletonii]
MSLQESLNLVASIKENVQQKITHHYLTKYIELPFIDEDRIILLLNSMVDQNIPKNDVEKFVTSAMLIQIALDTHDKVTNHGEDLKKRQLLVLSGDYFSGLYYKILAEVDNIPLIKVLAEGIKIVNESKIALYRNKDNDIDTYMNNLKNAESTIVTKFCSYFGSSHLYPIVEDILFLNRLIREREMVNGGETSALFEGLVKCIFPTKKVLFHQLSAEMKRRITDTYDQYITFSKNRLKEYLKELKNPSLLLGQRIKFLVMERQTVFNLHLEEG